MALEITVRDDSDFLHPENEWHPATLDRIEEDETQYGPTLKWIFYLDNDDPGREQFAWTSQTLSPRSKAYRWVKGIYGQAPEPGSVVDLGKLFGERVAVEFEHYDRGDGQTGEKVTRVKGLDEPKVEPATPPVTNKDLPF